MSGQRYMCKGVGSVAVQFGEIEAGGVEVFVVGTRPLDFEFILGINGIRALGGVQITPALTVSFGPTPLNHVCGAANALNIEERDFGASYDDQKKEWTVACKWADGNPPDALVNGIAQYAIPAHVKQEYEAEVMEWIDNGWLRIYDEAKYGRAKGLIPLMSVVQRDKGKVRPVMDFRELNSYVDAYTGNADVCADKLREWRRQGTNVSVIDLRKAYLQIHVHKSLWPYQTVEFRGKKYCLTRLGFGLNVSPMIMRSVLAKVLAQDARIQQAASPYIDDIYVNEDIATVKCVQEHLAMYGLECKPAERLSSGAKVLGLEVWGSRTYFVGNAVPNWMKCQGN
ncbi:Uncharacterised protein r2_g2574 [Pycnogonum litorale]